MPTCCITYIKLSTSDNPSWQPSWCFASLFCTPPDLPLIFRGQKWPFPPACRSRQRSCSLLSQQGFTDAEGLKWGPVGFPYTPNAGDVVLILIVWWDIGSAESVLASTSVTAFPLTRFHCSRPSERRQGNLISCISEMIVYEGRWRRDRWMLLTFHSMMEGQMEGKPAWFISFTFTISLVSRVES